MPQTPLRVRAAFEDPEGLSAPVPFPDPEEFFIPKDFPDSKDPLAMDFPADFDFAVEKERREGGEARSAGDRDGDVAPSDFDEPEAFARGVFRELRPSDEAPPGLSDEEKREKRLRRNRESAKKSRMRTHQQVATLRAKNAHLESSLVVLQREAEALRRMCFGGPPPLQATKFPLPKIESASVFFAPRGFAAKHEAYVVGPV